MLPTSCGAGYLWWGGYAGVALEMPATCGTDLMYLRIEYANAAIHYPGNITSPVSDTLHHVQFLHCCTNLWIEGNANAPVINRQISVGNCLFVDTGHAFDGSCWDAEAQHLTVDWCDTLTPGESPASFSLDVQNSVFSWLYAVGNGSAVTGNNNGFDPATYGMDNVFGSDPLTDDADWAFAPYTDPNTGQPSIANIQGAYYLRDGSPFIGVGTPDIRDALKADFAHMTTTVPEVFSADVTSSQTLSPTVPRDTGIPSLGYHYPVVDYVLNGATVNNCSLNIDQGTVLAFTAPFVYEWGLRLNPGGRLNVNGYPTNRVVFARLEAVQESPIDGWQNYGGPLITFKGVILPTGTLVTPLPEARFRYVDFPTLAGTAVHFGPLTYNQDQTYDCVSTLELSGCLLQGGEFVYESGGLDGRTVGLTNTIFERCWLELTDRQQNRGNEPELLTAANNLFYDSDLWLNLADGGSGCTLLDNIFDNSVFHGNGPNVQSSHSAYINMTGKHLPLASETAAQDLAALAYETGPLGRFYLPASATTLFGGGSRTAAAGLYHFTSLVDNTKEAAGQVNIGPAYVALDGNGNPFDSNAGGPDGVPDFLADRNGDGDEAGEMPWTSASTASLAILSPIEDATITGITQIAFSLDDKAPQEEWVDVLVDGIPQPCCGKVATPASSSAVLEVDTRLLANGSHTLAVRAFVLEPPEDAPDVPGYFRYSAPVAVNALNPFRCPSWQDRADLLVNVAAEADLASPEYTLWFFDPAYPKAYDPATGATRRDCTASSGIMSLSEAPSSLGYAQSDSAYGVFSAAEFIPSGSGGPVGAANPNIVKNSAFPTLGKWVVSYEDDASEYAWKSDSPGTLEGRYYHVVDPVDSANNTYFHYMNLGGWLGTAIISMGWNTGPWRIVPGTPGYNGQTWPVRGTEWRLGHLRDDAKTLLDLLANAEARNYYGYGHAGRTMQADRTSGPWLFSGMSIADLTDRLSGHRYRFVYLDSCESTTVELLKAFGADSTELAGPLDYSKYTQSGLWPGAFLAWGGIVRWWTPYGDGIHGDDAGEYYKPRAYFNSVLTDAWSIGVPPPSLADAITTAKALTRDKFPGVASDPMFDLNKFKHYGYRDLTCSGYDHAGDWTGN